MWRAGKRFARYAREGYQVVVLHLGDHDPSGIDMTRDIASRIPMFANIPDFPDDIRVHRVALNMDQVRRLKPPDQLLERR